MSEAALRATFRANMKAFGIVQRIEIKAPPGMDPNLSMEAGVPDLCCLLRFPAPPWQRGPNQAITSWVELKHEHEWPKRPASFLTLKRFKKSQLLWLEEWADSGGVCCVLLQVADEYLLLPPRTLRAVHAGATRTSLTGMAEVHGKRTFPRAKLLRWLTS